MSKRKGKYRFLLIRASAMASNNKSKEFYYRTDLPKEQRIMNYNDIKHLLEDVEWDLHPGAVASYGDWPVENREEFCHAAAGRLPIVREACESGKYNALVLLGGGQPGF
ncbi:hypothetical protein ACFLV9_01015, partial [Chloroflexota bacterium]